MLGRHVGAVTKIERQDWLALITMTINGDPSSDSTSSVRVTLDRVGERWLISGFDPMRGSWLS